jgi:hypothetical protein
MYLRCRDASDRPKRATRDDSRKGFVDEMLSLSGVARDRTNTAGKQLGAAYFSPRGTA